MFAIIGRGDVAMSQSPWLRWVEHIMTKKRKYGFKMAAMLDHDGKLVACSTDFKNQPGEIQKITKIFEKPQSGCDNKNNNNSRDCEQSRLELNRKTYIVKEVTEQQVVAFNGSKHMIMCRSNRMYIIVVCDLRNKQKQAADWLTCLCDHLRKNGH